MRLLSILLAAGLVATSACSPASADGPVTPTGKVSPAAGWRAQTVVDGLENPWSVAWLPDGAMLITERPGRLQHIDTDGKRTQVSGVPKVLAMGQGGLMEVSLHPDFAQNRTLYLTYSAGTREANHTRMARATLDGNALRDVQEIFKVNKLKNGGAHFGSRIQWLPDGTMLLAIGDGGNPPIELEGEFIRNQAQNPGSHLGKLLRLNDDGTAPADNPDLGPDAAPEVFSWGHRNIQGIARDPQTGRIWVTEHGARGGDELNLIRPGANYGWPLATYSREYFGPEITTDRTLPGKQDPKAVWTPALAPSGLAFYTGQAFPQWQGDLFAGGLVAREIRRVDLEGENVVGQDSLRFDARVRDVRQGPDGHLYVLTDEKDGKLLRIVPE